MKNLGGLIALSAVVPFGIALAADVPSFRSGEYEVTTSFGDSQTMSKKVCLTDYEDWFGSLRDDFKERGCNLAADGQSGAVYRYRMDCSTGASGTLAVTKLSDSNFESVAEIQLPIAGFMQTISTRDNARRLGDCPPE
jgi:hypothetical protein